MQLPTTLGALALAAAALWISSKWSAYRRILSSLGNVPGPRYFTYSLGLLSFRAHPKYLTPPRNNNFLAKHQVYEDYGWDIVLNVFAWPSARGSFWVCDAEAIKEIVTSRQTFVKPVALYELLSVYGRNIVATEGDEWRKHRKISQPAFSEKNNRLVWEETTRIVQDMVGTWDTKDAVEVNHVVDITLPIALLVIGSAGFGIRVGWNEEFVAPVGHKMSFRTALSTVCKDLFLRLVVPRWASGLTQRYRNIYNAFDELKQYMQEMIDERRNSTQGDDHHDLFSNLIRASDEETDSASSLSPDELMGNVFIFLLAGHETTAHTLAFTFALLALYPDEQELVYKQIKDIVPEGKAASYADMPLLTRAIAVFYETLRLYPPVNLIPKVAAEDATLPCSAAALPGFDAGIQGLPRKTVHIPKGTRLTLHVPGLHYNPRYWKNPEAFNPERFMGDWPKEAFLPFSGGARSCIGRRFFETEGIAVMATLLSQYKIEVKEDPCFANETFEQRKARLLRSKAGLTLTPVEVPLVFRRRK